jgi:hypothetical protein
MMQEYLTPEYSEASAEEMENLGFLYKFLFK